MKKSTMITSGLTQAKISSYSFLQKTLAVVLLFSVMMTTLIVSDLGIGGLFEKTVKAKVSGEIISFIDVPTETIHVDAGIAKEKIVFPKILGSVVKDGDKTKNVYFDAAWVCPELSDDSAKTALSTTYTFTLDSASLPADLSDEVDFPQITVQSGKYCIKGFKEISSDLIAKTITVGERVTFPATVDAFVGDDKTATPVEVNWSFGEILAEGGSSHAFTDLNEKYTFKAIIKDTDKYCLSKELMDANVAAATIPLITIYVISDAVAYVGNGGFATLSEAYAVLEKSGGSGTIIIKDFYEYYADEENHDPAYVVVKTSGDNYSDSYFHEPQHDGMVVIKGETPEAILKMDYRFYLGGHLMFRDITLQAGTSMKERIYANGYDLVMSTGLTCKWGSELTAGYAKEYSNALRIYGGSATTDLYDDTRVVILSGDYYLVRGGNEEGGTVYGDTFVYLGGTAHTYYQLMGGSRKGDIAGGSYVIVNGNAVADGTSGGVEEIKTVAVFGGGQEGCVKGDKDGDGVVESGTHTIINGGTVNAAITGSGMRETYNGKTFVTVCGDGVVNAGVQGALFIIGDGSNGSSATGDSFANVFCNAKLCTSENSKGHIYGTNTPNNTESNIVINVFDNAYVDGSVNGGAYAANSGIGYDGDGKIVTVNVYGSAYIAYNVYGGSLRKGVNGDTFVNVTENATVEGNVYGGGQGAASGNENNQYGEAMNSSLYISGNVSIGGDVYGGGNYGYNRGHSTVTVENVVLNFNVFGGSQSGGTFGTATANVYGSKIARNVYGANGELGTVYAETGYSIVKIGKGSIISGSVYGGGKAGATAGTSVNVEDATVKGSVYGGGETGYTGSTNVVVKGNTTVDGDVFGAGKNAGADKTYVETRGGFYNNIYGGGETGYAKSVEIRICNTESAFAYDIKGEINGLPKNTASTEEIARNFNSDSVYTLVFDGFGGEEGKSAQDFGTVKAVKNFSGVEVFYASLTFKDTEGEYFEGVTALSLVGNNAKIELPGKATLCSAFTEGGVYSTAKSNVLPSVLSGEDGSAIYMPSRISTDEEEMSANGKVTPVLAVYGYITGNIELFTDGEKKSGTYVTSFDGQTNKGEIEQPTIDYMHKNRSGVRTGHNRNFAKYMSEGFDTGAFKLQGANEVYNSERVFTTILAGEVGLLDGKNTVNWIIWSGKPYADIAILKEAETSIGGSTAPIAGVEFTLYEDAECTKVIETVTTNEKGEALSVNHLAENITYYVKETKAPDGYILDETVYSITLTNADSGKTVALTEGAIINYLKNGTITVYKTSDDGVALAGVQFAVSDDAGYYQVITTDASGYATTGKLLYGTYTVTELSNPNPGFETPDFTKEIKVDDANKEWSIDVTNNRVKGKINLTKVDEDGNAVEGVVFNVYSDKALETIVDTITTDANGFAETKYLTIYGESTTYYVVEVVTKDELVLRTDVFEATLTPDSPFALAADEGDRVIKNIFKKATISITKKGENDALLSGVMFGIYSDAECTEIVETLTTDENGAAVSSALKLGKYFVKELSNPDATYIVSDTVYTFELTENEKVYEKTIYNVKAGAYITLEKVDSHGNPVANVEFEIRNDKDEVVEVIKTDEKGSAISSALVINVGSKNVFTVKEISAPEYVFMSDVVYEVVIENDNEIVAVNDGAPIVNNVKEGVITLDKVNEKGEKLEGVEFTVYSDEKLENAVAVIVTDKDGKGVSEVLPYGTYYVKETKNPDASYVVASDVYTVVIDGESVAVNDGKAIVNKKLKGSLTVKYTAENDEENQDVVINVVVNGKTYIGKLVINGTEVETTNGKVTVKNGDSFVIELECGDTFVVVAETEGLKNLVSLTYNGEEAEDFDDKVTEEKLHHIVDIKGEFVVPAKPGDMGMMAFFAVLALISACGIFVLQQKKKRVRG